MSNSVAVLVGYRSY